MTQEQRQALLALRDADGIAPVEALDPETRVGLMRMNYITLGNDRKVRLTDKGREALGHD